MTVVGIDLAASPATTGIARLDGRRLTDLEVGVDDDRIVALTEGATKIGIDCPLGWPRAFVGFVAEHERGRVTPRADTIEARRPLVYRETDLWVMQHHPPLRPLSVSADRIGHAALRGAGLLARLGEEDRSGIGRVVEVYPAASLRQWGLDHQGYKGPGTAQAGRRARIVEALNRAIDLGPFATEVGRSDHALDAVVSALTAHAAHCGSATGPGQEHLPTARVEGWITIPIGTLADLAAGWP